MPLSRDQGDRCEPKASKAPCVHVDGNEEPARTASYISTLLDQGWDWTIFVTSGKIKNLKCARGSWRATYNCFSRGIAQCLGSIVHVCRVCLGVKMSSDTQYDHMIASYRETCRFASVVATALPPVRASRCRRTRSPRDWATERYGERKLHSALLVRHYL